MSVAASTACAPRDLPDSSYFDERIQPILTTSCVRQNTGCHLATPDGLAAGNLDLTSFDSMMRRDDVLDPYGPYPAALLLLKPGDDVEIPVETWDPPMGSTERVVTVSTDVRHAGGTTVDLGSSGYALIQRWIREGRQRTGVPDETLRDSEGACVQGAGTAPGYDPAAMHDAVSYQRFRDTVMPVMEQRCAGSVCHGNRAADLFLACGDDDAEMHWNYWISLQFVTDPVSTSELLRRPLSTLRGGTFHEGGNVFGSTEDGAYQVIRDWAEELVMRRPELIEPVVPPELDEEGLRFFANRVQPVLIREGCMFLNCHSPAMFHDLRLRGGSGGHFGRIATVRNYMMTRDLLALDSPDPNESRVIAKNLFPAEQVAGSPGLFHRGGSLLEDFGANGMGAPNLATPDDCAGVDADNGDLDEIPGYCVLVRWHEIERANAIASGEIDADPVRGVVWVQRPVGVGRPADFDTYRGGADLMFATATIAADESLSLGAPTSLLGGCGLSAASADVRGPTASWDGERIAFAARSSADAPYRLYWMEADGTGCEQIPGIAPATDRQDGILLHDFDPVFSSDGRLIFASTRGYSDPEIVGRTGPTRTPSEMAPNANLYIRDADGSIRQLTFLLNQEFQPAFMTDQRLIFTAEKRAFEFRQLAGRRLNLDGGDYHPLFAQRDSVGYSSATEIAELPDRNLVMVGAPLDAADGAGTIVVVNRSIGPDQTDRDPADRAYIHSMRFPVGSALDGGTGVFRSPVPLPTGRLLASCDLDATSVTAGGFDFDLCEIDVDTGAIRSLVGVGGQAEIEAAVVWARAERETFRSRPDEANGHTEIVPGERDATILYTDAPMLATLLFSNTRIGRPIDQRIAGLDVMLDEPPPAGATGFGDVMGSVRSDAFGMFYESTRMLGHVDLAPDGSGHIRITGGAGIRLRPTDHSGAPLVFDAGAPFTGEMIQREAVQFYPGERIRQSMPRGFFNALCGGCHGSISGRELDTAADIDIMTRASPRVIARDEDPVDMR